jgi:hypothetical protein
MSLEIGDLVIVTRQVVTNSQSLYKKMGRLKHLLEDRGARFGVEFMEPVGGHNLNGNCLSPYGWYCQEKDLQKMEPLSVLLAKQRDREDVIHLGHIKQDMTIFIEE